MEKWWTPLLLVGLLAAMGQAPRKPAATAQQCRITGRVMNVTTGKPVSDVSIVFARPAGPKLPDAFYGAGGKTGADGRFDTGPIKPGLYILQGWRYDSVKRAYVPSQFDQVVGTNARLNLLPGQKLTGLNIEMESPGEISGRVLDANGKPAAGVSVQAVGVGYAFLQNGKKYKSGEGQPKQTDRFGNFHLTGIAPGPCFVEATSGRGFPASPPVPAFFNVYVANSFYPSGGLNQAKTVDVPPGKQISGITIRFPERPDFR